MILILDDLPKNLQLLGSILKDQGYKVEFVTNGIQAIDWLKENDFALVLLDVMMPEMEGYELLEAIRKEKSTKHIPVILVTASVMKHKLEE